MPPATEAPEPREIVRRFNEACAALDAAIGAAQVRDAARHDAELLQAAREMGSALELAVVRCLVNARLDVRPERIDFPDMLKILRAVLPRHIDERRVEQLKAFRQLRNRAEHAPVEVPRLRELLRALRGTRRLLCDTLDERDTAGLADPDHPQRADAPARASDPTAPPVSLRAPAVRDDAHRDIGPQAWIKEHIVEGLRRLTPGAADTGAVPLLREHVRTTLEHLAWELAQRGTRPKSAIPDVALSKVRDELRLYLEAGWLDEDEKGIRFHDARAPALLVGVQIAQTGAKGAGMRAKLRALRTWGETAWAAARAGDTIDEWVQPLFDRHVLERYPDHVVTASAALAGAAKMLSRNSNPTFAKAAATAAVALVWFVPPIDHERATGAVVSQQPDAWRLDAALWQRAVIDVALVMEKLSAHPLDWRRPEGALGAIVSALAMEPSLSETNAQAVLSLCDPWPRDGASPLDDMFFRACIEHDGLALRVDQGFFKIWLSEVGIGALRRADARKANRMLAASGPGGITGMLFSRGMLADWCEAWECLADEEPGEESARAWARGARWAVKYAVSDEAVMEFLFEHAPKRLRDLGVWELARAALCAELTVHWLPSQPDKIEQSYGVRLLRLAEFSDTEWRATIQAWGREPYLPWSILIEAGAPQDAIAQWCVEKLRQKERDAPHRDEPIGVLASGGAVVAADGWQLAFNQARESLFWMLDHGDEGAITVLADACFPGGQDKAFDPIVGKYVAGLVIPLSQWLWGCVVQRPAGRAALYARMERGVGLNGSAHFLPGVAVLSSTDQLWITCADVVIHLLGSEGAEDEARRLLSAFERWIEDPTAAWWRREPERPPWADSGARGAKALVLLCAAMHGLDVAAPLQTLLQSIIDDNRAEERELLSLLGLALDNLCSGEHDAPTALLTAAAAPEVARLLANDVAVAFWGALLRVLGVERVIALLDVMSLPDAGLSVFDAFLEAETKTLEEIHTRPDLLRSVLVRSAQKRFSPSPLFYERAWEKPRTPEEIKDLNRIPMGEWVQSLITRSRSWPRDGEGRGALLRLLARTSVDPEVRRHCLEALIEHG